MDKCTYCAGGPERGRTTASTRSTAATGSPQGKLPLCAEMCSTKSLLAGDGEIIAQIYKERVTRRGYGSGAWGWQTAYKDNAIACLNGKLSSPGALDRETSGSRSAA